MRQNFIVPNLGSATRAYNGEYLNRLVRNIEMTFADLRIKGIADFSGVSIEQLTVNEKAKFNGPLQVDGAAGAARYIWFSTADSTRWIIAEDASPESGGNLGSDFAIYRYSDTGVYLGQPLYIQRSSGAVVMENDVFINQTLSVFGAASFTGLTTTNGQVAFPAVQNPSANANTLDDYEENPWTPGIAFGGASVGITYGTRIARYTKIGNVVNIWADITLTAKGSSTGAATITGLPFAVSTVTGSINVSYGEALTGLTGTPVATVGGSNISLRVWGATGTGSITDANFTNTTRLIVGGSYMSA